MRLKQARKVNGKSQQEVAVENDLALSGYRRIESGDVQRPGITSVYGIARSICVDPYTIDEFAATLDEYETAIGLTATAQQSGGAEHFYSRERFEEMVNREVERRMMTLASQSTGDEQVAAQSNESNVT